MNASQRKSFPLAAPWSTTHKIVKSVRQIARYLGLAVGAAVLVPLSHAQMVTGLGSPIQLNDNVANQGSPFVLNFNGNMFTYYVNHANNTIYVDENFSNSPASTGITVNTAELTDVQAAAFNGQVVLVYDQSISGITFATSTNGISFSNGTQAQGYQFGMSGPIGIYQAVVPALAVYNGQLYAAVVGSDNKIYVGHSTNGTSYTPASTTPASQTTTNSRPGLAAFNSNLYLSFVNLHTAYVGPLFSGSTWNPVVVNQPGSWSNSNRDGNRAGLAMTVYNSALYITGQSSFGSNYMYQMGTYDGVNYNLYQVQNSPQLRWTPSTALSRTNQFYIVFQGNGNTNVDLMHN